MPNTYPHVTGLNTLLGNLEEAAQNYDRYAIAESRDALAAARKAVKQFVVDKISETKVPNTLNEDAAVKFARTWLLATGSLTLEQVDKYAKPLARDIIKAALS